MNESHRCYVEPKKFNTCYVIYFYKIQEETKLAYDEGNQNRDCLWWPIGLSGKGTRKFWWGGWWKRSRSWLVVVLQMHIFDKTHQTVHLLCLSMYANWNLIKKLNWKESQTRPVPEAGNKIGNRAGRALSRGSFCLAPVLINDRAGGKLRFSCLRSHSQLSSVLPWQHTPEQGGSSREVSGSCPRSQRLFLQSTASCPVQAGPSVRKHRLRACHSNFARAASSSCPFQKTSGPKTSHKKEIWIQ